MAWDVSDSELYRQELRDLHHRRVYFIVVVGVVLTTAFSSLDFLMYREHFATLLLFRFAVVAIGVLLAVLNLHDNDKRYALVLGFSGYLAAGGVILLMLLYLDDPLTPYYVGLIIAMTMYTGIAPLTVTQALLSGFALVCGYLLAMLWMNPELLLGSITLFSNCFFMVCFVFIAATQCWTESHAREQEFQLRVDEKQVADELADQADLLEEAVKRRTKEREAADRRYRLLFDRLADDVAVVSPEGALLQSNAAFDRHFGRSATGNGLRFLDIVHAKQREQVEEELSRLVRDGVPLQEYQVFLLAKDGSTIEAEINGTVVRRGGAVIGAQLVLRDIRIRRILEYHLLESLRRIKQVEVATILSLVKLSEYRDVTPGQHLERIREYCRTLAGELARRASFADRVSQGYIDDLYNASILHDIGKVSIPDAILRKESHLSDAEVDLVRRHTLSGGDVIKAMEEESGGSSFLNMAKHIAYFHHEHWDGNGFPQGLRGEEIPLEARIMAVADAYEEMTTGIEIKPALSHGQAVQAIINESGRRFDPTVVEALLHAAAEFDRIRQKLSEQRAGGEDETG